MKENKLRTRVKRMYCVEKTCINRHACHPQLFVKTLLWYSDTAGNHADAVEVGTSPSGGAGTRYPFVEDEEVLKPGRYLTSYVAPGSGPHEVKNSTTSRVQSSIPGVWCIVLL